MNHRFLLGASFAIFSAAACPAAVLQAFAGPISVTGGGVGTSLVSTGSDTGDWMNAYSGGTATVPLYIQFTMSVTNNNGETGAGGFYSGLHLYQGTGERFLVGNEWNSTAWSVFSNGSPAILGTVLNGNPGTGGANVITPTETVNFVVKLDQATSTATVWFNADLGLTELAQDSGLTTTITGLGTGDTFDTIRLRAGNGSGAATYSAITFRDDSPFAAVPEPSAALLGGIGVIAMFGLRRRL